MARPVLIRVNVKPRVWLLNGILILVSVLQEDGGLDSKTVVSRTVEEISHLELIDHTDSWVLIYVSRKPIVTHPSSFKSMEELVDVSSAANGLLLTKPVSLIAMDLVEISTTNLTLKRMAVPTAVKISNLVLLPTVDLTSQLPLHLLVMPLFMLRLLSLPNTLPRTLMS
jgi:membrane-associated protease RseP (regulator of RpoE activity)